MTRHQVLGDFEGVVPMPNAFTHGYALLVGVGQSAYPPWSLPVTVKDIQAIRAILTDPHRAYPGDDRHIRLIHDKTATRAAILDGLAWLKGKPPPTRMPSPWSSTPATAGWTSPQAGTT